MEDAAKSAAISDISCSYLDCRRSVHRSIDNLARVCFPTIRGRGRRSIVPHVNYLQKINLKRVGADLLLTIYRPEKSFVTQRCDVMKNGPVAVTSRGHVRARAIVAKIQQITCRNSLSPLKKKKKLDRTSVY